jgi:SH3-like domain-containing protein
MPSKFGFDKFSIQEFEDWINSITLARTVLHIQQHHTYNPGYALFKENNHFELQQGMKNYHVNQNGWNDIGQHFTTFPDGSIVTGRALEKSPACILGQNANAICIEHLGNFDAGKDIMTPEHRETIIRMTAKLCRRFNLPVDTNSIHYHHWFDLSTGQRNNGTKNNKSCPGTGFFGGNKVQDCQLNFLPLISGQVPAQPIVIPEVLKYVSVTASKLNIRIGPGITKRKVNGKVSAGTGAVLRVYAEENGWFKISNSKEHWISARYTLPVTRAKVSATTLNVRNGPDISFEKLGSLTKGQEVFIAEEKNGWCRLNMEDKWLSKSFLVFG